MEKKGKKKEAMQQKQKTDALERDPVAELLEREGLYRVLVDNAFDAIYLLLGKRYEYVNPRFCEITGYTFAELTSPDFDYNVLLPEESQRFMEERYLARSRGESIDSQYALTILNKAGERLDVEVSTTNIGGPGEMAVLGIMRDITLRRRAETSLRESKSKYGSLFESIRDAVYITSRDGHFLDVNPAAIELFGFESRGEIIGRSVAEIYSDINDRPRLTEMLEKSGSVKDYPIKLCRVDGTELDCLLTSTVRRDEEGRIIGYQGIIRDVTAVKRLEHQLWLAHKMEAVGQLAGGVAHDFNNLLTVISGHTELSLMRMKEEDPMRDTFLEIQKATQRAANLTHELLAFSRRQTLRPSDVNVNRLLNEVLPTFKQAVQNGIRFEVEQTTETWNVKADADQLHQVIRHLMTNAIEAMPEGGKLSIRTANIEVDDEFAAAHPPMQSGRYVSISVADSGPGMSEQVRSRIFEPFYSTKGLEKGGGLGLAVAYGVVKQSGGFIWVDSHPGEGSVFTIYLPTAESAGKVEPALVQETDEQVRRESILVVEDDETVRDMIREMLKSLGYRVFVVSNGREAMAFRQSSSHKVELVISDIVMPLMNGWELAEEMWRNWPDQKILFMSGYTAAAETPNRFGDREIPFLQKPFKFDTLTKQVREILKAG